MFLLYHPTTQPTGRRLARRLGIPFGVRLPLQNPDLLFRWGNSEPIPAHWHCDEYNWAEGIRKASDKRQALYAFEDANIPCPTWTSNPYIAQQWAQEGHTIFGRSAYGSGGSDIQIVQPGQYMLHHAWYSKYIPNTREYRIHVVDGIVIWVQRKYLDDPQYEHIDERYDNIWIRNHSRGYVFKTPQRPLRPDRLNAAKAAVAALGLDFGAADIVIGEDDVAYVLEVNTAPALAPLTMEAYVPALMNLMEG